MGELEAPTLLRSFSRSEMLVLVCGLARLGPSLPVPDGAKMGSLPSIRSFLRLGSPAPSLDRSQAGFSAPSRNYMRTESPTLLMGTGCVGFVFALPVVADTRPGSSLLLQSLSCPGFATPVSNFAQLGSMLLVRGSVRSGPTPLLLGVAKSDYVYSLPVLGISIFASSLLVHSSVHMDLLLPALDPATLGPSASLHNSACLGSAPPVSGAAWPGTVLLACDFSGTESPVLLRSFIRLGSATLVFSLIGLEPSPLSKAFACSGSFILALGIGHAGPVFFLSVADTVSPGSPASLQSCTRIDSVLSATDSTHVDLLLSLQGPS